MIRLEGGKRSRLRVIGSLDGRTVRRLFEAISRGAVVLDLSEVDQANESAVMFLARLPEERCRLHGSPSWLTRCLERCRESAGAVSGRDESGSRKEG